MKRIYLIALLIAFLIMSLFLSGYVDKCRQDAEEVDRKIAEDKAKAVNPPEPAVSESSKTSATEPVSNDSKNVETSQSSTLEDVQAMLEWPEGWPLPQNDKIVLEVSTKKNGDDYTSWQIIGKYPGPADEIYNYYKEKSGGFTISGDESYDKGNNIKSYQLQINSSNLKAILVFEDTSDSQSAVSIYVEVSD